LLFTAPGLRPATQSTAELNSVSIEFSPFLQHKGSVVIEIDDFLMT